MQESKIKKTDPEKKFRRVLSASTLAGDRVRNAAGEDLGKIDEIMIDIPSGRVAYAVLSFGGILKIGNRLFAVPWSSLRVDEDETFRAGRREEPARKRAGLRQEQLA